MPPDEIPDWAHSGERPPGWELKNHKYQPDQITDFDFEWRFGRRRHCPEDVGQQPHIHCPKCNLVAERHVGGELCRDEPDPKPETSES